MPAGEVVTATSPATVASSSPRARRSSLADNQLALVISAVLFVCAAWPLVVVRIPPYQDLPGHLAAVTILANPDRYPELVATGFMKPNSFFFLWTLTAGRSIGFVLAAKIFAAAVLAGIAFVLPRFVLHFTDRARMVFAAPLLVPMVHNWFVSMGMLSFAASLVPSFLLLIELDRLCSKTGGRTSVSMVKATLLALLSWYLHPFPILIVGLLVFAAIVSELVIEKRGQPLRARFERIRVLAPPLIPSALLAFYIFSQHVAVTGKEMDTPEYSTLGWSLYNLWGQFFYGFTEATAVSLVPAAVLGALAFVRWRSPDARTITSALPFVALVAMYMLGPYVAFDANYIAPRFVPFFWALALVRIPSSWTTADTMAKKLLPALLYACAAIYVAGMSYDMLRLARELDDYEAGASVIPDGARLLQMNFNPRPTSKNTFTLGTAWGLYVLDRHASAIDAWANVPSMPIVYKTVPPKQLDPMMRLRFIKNAATKDGYCGARRWNGFYSGNCELMWAEEWSGFWRDVSPGFDYLLFWDPPGDVLTTIPPTFHEVLRRDRLHIYERLP